MRGKILERKHVTRREGDNGVGIAGGGELTESLKNGDEVFYRPIVVDDEDKRAVGGPPEEHEQQGFRGGGESRDTDTPRALFEVGGSTREAGKRFNVREEFTDEGKKHAG